MNDTFENGNTMPPAIGDSWTPVLRGSVFCSPACGHSCTRADFDQATSSAAALVAELGEGWAPRVWENGGWYFSAVKGSATVDYSQSEGQFSASIDAGLFGNRQEMFTADGSSPRSAVEAALAKIEQKIAALTRTARSAALEALKLEAA